MKIFKRIIFMLVALAGTALLVLAILPSPIPVSTAEVEKGYFAEITEDEGFTRLRDTSLFSAPVSGYLHRVRLEPGDTVQAGQTLFKIEPIPAPALDSRTIRQAQENLLSLKAASRAARADYDNALHRTSLARKELDRHLKLFENEIIPESTMDRVQSELDQALAVKDSAREAVAVADYNVEYAKAVLEVSTGARQGPDQALEIKALENALVLRRHRHQEGVVNAGESILETGDLKQLEVRVDLLSVEAVRVRPGMRVILSHWGEKIELKGQVRLVEPAGFKRVSALGVDEQRVPVFVRITSPREEWEYLGEGYRVEAKFVLWESDDAVFVPTSSLFRKDDQWYAFGVQEGRASLRQVEIGRRSGLKTQIIKGLKPGEIIITHPGDRISHGTHVEW